MRMVNAYVRMCSVHICSSAPWPARAIPGAESYEPLYGVAQTEMGPWASRRYVN